MARSLEELESGAAPSLLGTAAAEVTSLLRRGLASG